MTSAASAYDAIGGGYAATRHEEPTIDAAIREATAGCSSIVNVGAGAGSYEPASTVAAVEPSLTMTRQRPRGSAPAIRAVAEYLPLTDDAVAGALGVLTVHHWDSVKHGMAELRRVSRDRIVLLTADIDRWRSFWLVDRYFPSILRLDEQRIPRIETLSAEVARPLLRSVPIPANCRDGFTGAFWSRPEAYLEPAIRAGMSGFQVMDPSDLRDGLERLRRDLGSGKWDEEFGYLRTQESLDLGYRLLVGAP